MEYKDIKTPEQLLKYMIKNIKYGFVDDNGKVYGLWDNQEFQEGCQTKWHLSSPERLIKVKYGHCQDKEGKYNYFEHSDSSNIGVHQFETYEDAINYQMKKHIEHNKERSSINEEILNSLHVYEYDKPMYGCTMSEFIDYILNNTREVEIKKQNKINRKEISYEKQYDYICIK